MKEVIQLPEQIKQQNSWVQFSESIQKSQLSIEQWDCNDSHIIYEKLEHPNWAPWLEASQPTIESRAKVFPKGQLLIKDHGVMVASLSLNQISWDGNPNHLPSWDQIAGEQTTDYSETYDQQGNTLVLMSMNVVAEAKGKQLPTKLIEHVKLLAKELYIEHIIGSFRPTGYGSAKKQSGYTLPFWDYCTMRQPGSEKPVDPWLRSLWWNGMQLLKEDSQAMQVTVSVEEFNKFQQTYKPDDWTEVKPGVWECGEVGMWTIGTENAIYNESNAWGYIPH